MKLRAAFRWMQALSLLTVAAWPADLFAGDQKGMENEAQAALALTPENELTPAQIGQRVADTLRTTKKIREEFEAVQDNPPMSARSWTIMAPGRAKTIAFRGDGAFLAAFTSNDGQIVEVRPGWRKREDGTVVHDFKRNSYAASGPNGKSFTPNPSPYDCLWGGGTGSEVGPTSESAELWQERIGAGLREPDQSIEGRDLFVVSWEARADNGYQVHMRFFVEKATNRIVQREDRLTYPEGVVINRTFRHRYWTEGIPDPPWTITDDELVDRSRRTVGAPDPPMAVPLLVDEEAPATPEPQPPKSSAVLDYLDSKAISGTKKPD